MIDNDHSLDMFIFRLARKIAILYPNNCADEEDYIQAGHLKLAEINYRKYEKRDFQAYAIIAVARAMRETALGAIGATSAPDRVKRLIHKIELLLIEGKTEKDICKELRINAISLTCFKSLIGAESWYQLFDEPTHIQEPFSVIDDMLLSNDLTEKDKEFIFAQFEGEIDSLGMTRKQRWIQTKSLRGKLTRSGYEIG